MQLSLEIRDHNSAQLFTVRGSLGRFESIVISSGCELLRRDVTYLSALVWSRLCRIEQLAHFGIVRRSMQLLFMVGLLMGLTLQSRTFPVLSTLTGFFNLAICIPGGPR
jgi:hypothetical protein